MNIAPGNRTVLACQHRIKSDLIVTIPPVSRFFGHKILENGIEISAGLTADIYKKYTALTTKKDILGLAIDIGTTMKYIRCYFEQPALERTPFVRADFFH